MTTEGNNDPTYYRAWLALREGGSLPDVTAYLSELRPELGAFASRLHDVMSDDERRMLARLALFVAGLEDATSGKGPAKLSLNRVSRGNPSRADELHRHKVVSLVAKQLRQKVKREAAIQAAIDATGHSRSTISKWLADYKPLWDYIERDG